MNLKLSDAKNYQEKLNLRTQDKENLEEKIIELQE